MLAQRQKQAVALQYFAALAPEGFKAAPACRIGRTPAGVEQLLQDGELDCRNFGVVHKGL
jgi:hypothetical protein